MKPQRLLAVLAIIALAGALAYFSLRASAYLQYIPWMPRQIGIWADSHGISRNTVAFLVLGLAVYLFVDRRWLAVIGVCLFATALEVAQLWIPSRAFDWRDIVASVAGALLAWPIAWVVHRCRSA